jgi:hypothetical protein
MNWKSSFRFSSGLLICAALAPWARGSEPVSAKRIQLYGGWLQMYDLQFDAAHRTFAQSKLDRPSDPLAFVSDAAAYVFAELARLGALESEFFVDDSVFVHQKKLAPDPQAKLSFTQAMAQADRLTDAVLQKNPSDSAGLFAKSLGLGLRADYAALVDKQFLAALGYTKESRVYAEQLLAADPQAFDAYLGPGIENYLLSLKAAPLRLLLRITGSKIDRDKGLEEVRMTSAHGYYLEPFAKLLLAVSALRDHNPAQASQILRELHQRFPHNALYERELERLSTSH